MCFQQCGRKAGYTVPRTCGLGGNRKMPWQCTYPQCDQNVRENAFQQILRTRSKKLHLSLSIFAGAK